MCYFTQGYQIYLRQRVVFQVINKRKIARQSKNDCPEMNTEEHGHDTGMILN